MTETERQKAIALCDQILTTQAKIKKDLSAAINGLKEAVDQMKVRQKIEAEIEHDIAQAVRIGRIWDDVLGKIIPQ